MTIAQTQLSNAKVSLFFDSNFSSLDSPTDEAPSMKRSLEAAGHVVTTFDGTTTDAWRTATDGADVLVIPQISGNPALTPGALFFLKDFVSKGGTLIVVSETDAEQSGTDLINTVFGTALVELAYVGASTPTADVNGTTFGADIPLLSDNGSTDGLQAASLPDFARSLYETAGGDSTVAAFQFGMGQIVWLGWDWYRAEPLPGVQDGGWLDILDQSVSVTDFKPNGVDITGKKGNDKVKVDALAKAFKSTDRDDVITLNKGDDKAFGGGGHDVIYGEKGEDRLHGGEGDDIVNGGKNKDKLWGDLGGDYFMFDQRPGRKHADEIKDFMDGIDMILLKQNKFAGLTAGDMSTAQFAAHIKYTANGWLKYDGQKFAKLDPGLAISETDFLVV